MKRFITIMVIVQLVFMISIELAGQSVGTPLELGITAGAFTNFPANKDYLKKDISVFYVAPYLRAGQHEFSLGIVYPVKTDGLFFNDKKITPCAGAIAGYKFYIFDVAGRENLFVHYSFQYLRFKGNFETQYSWNPQPDHWTETDMYINNVIGFGYNLFFDTNERFGFYYTLDYIISQTGYKMGYSGYNENSWTTRYVWNNLSTHLGFSFKLTSLKKEDKRTSN